MLKIDSKDILYILIIVGLVILLFTKSCNKDKMLDNQIVLINALNDTLKKVTNKLGQEESRTSILETARVSDFIKIKSKDSILFILQGKVKYYKNQLNNGSSVTVIGNTTDINTTGETNITGHDTIYLPQSQIEIFPVYEMTTESKWYDIKVKASQDSINIKLKVENEYSVIVGEEGKWYQRKVPFVEVTNNNPYTKTRTLKTYQVSKPIEKRFGLGVIVGYGFGLNGLTPMVGVGVNYNLIKF